MPPSRAPNPSYVTLPPCGRPYPAILDFLDGRFPRVGRETWRRRLAAGDVTDDRGGAVTAETPYRPHLRLRYFREVPAEAAVPFAEAVLHRDAHLLVADKPHFLPVTPAGGYVRECLLYRLRQSTGAADLVPLHRLDRETAGVVLFSVNPATREAYSALFRRRRIRKRYEALGVWTGGAATGEWRVANRIVPGDEWFRSKIVEGPVNARTLIRLLEVHGGVGRFDLEPLTGKRHQLRLHMACIGSGIVNDWLYPELHPAPKSGFDRPLQLVARELGFTDPLSGVERVFRSRAELQWPG